MSKNNNHDIESLFQKAAEEYPADFEEKHWQNLKVMLDEQKSYAVKNRNNKIRRSLLALGVLILFSTGTFWFTSENTSDNEQGSVEISETEFSVEEKKGIDLEKEDKVGKYNSDVAKEISKKSDSDEKGGVEIATTATRNPIVEEASGSQLNPLTIGADKKYKVAKKDAENNALTAPTTENSGTIADFKKKPEVQNSIRAKDSQAEADDRFFNNPSSDESELNNLQSDLAAKAVEGGNNKHLNISDTLGIKPEIETDSLFSESEEKPIVEKQQKHEESPLLSVTFAVGPDLSVIGLKDITSPGYSYGVMVHYNISQKWSLGIGALKTTKKYVGDGNDYQPPKGYWEYATNNVIPLKVSGECALIEIPIDIRYDFLGSSKNHFYVSGGVSSYFMQSESYEYSFEEYNPYASQSWSAESAEGDHLFNILNLSVGYERAIGRKFRIGIAPYVKAPVKGIGWAEVKFISFGTYFNLKYNLFTRNK
jgi:hypothetical protein